MIFRNRPSVQSKQNLNTWTCLWKFATKIQQRRFRSQCIKSSMIACMSFLWYKLMNLQSIERKRNVLIDFCWQHYRDFKKRIGTSFQSIVRFQRWNSLFGMLIGENGIIVNLNMSKLLSSCQRPSSIMDICSLLELLLIFRGFIPNFAKVVSPLKPWQKNESAVHNWDEIVKKPSRSWTAITQSPVLLTPNWE